MSNELQEINNENRPNEKTVGDEAEERDELIKTREGVRYLTGNDVIHLPVLSFLCHRTFPDIISYFIDSLSSSTSAVLYVCTKTRQ